MHYKFDIFQVLFFNDISFNNLEEYSEKFARVISMLFPKERYERIVTFTFQLYNSLHHFSCFNYKYESIR